MKELLKNLLNLEKPVLTKTLAPKLAPFARIIYLVAMVCLAITTLGVLWVLLNGNLSAFILGILGVIAEFAIIRMFCEYLISTERK